VVPFSSAMFLFRLLVGAAFLLFTSTCFAEYARVAVASNFTAPMKKIEAAFNETYPHHKLTFSYASSGKLYAQIVHGAPYALFFSADSDKPKRLIEDGLAVKSSRFTYAVGVLALWAGGSEISHNPASFLQSKGRQKLAIANPKLAPFGEAATQVLDYFDISSGKLQIIKGENVSQAYQFVYSGNVPFGFVALSQIIDKDRREFWVVPPHLHKPIIQDAVLMASENDNKAALAFMDFIQSEQAKRIIIASGYREKTEAIELYDAVYE